jgi:hypothetical protein
MTTFVYIAVSPTRRVPKKDPRRASLNASRIDEMYREQWRGVLYDTITDRDREAWASQFTHISIPNTIAIVEPFVLMQFKHLVEIVFPDSVEYIQASACESLEKLARVDIGNGVQYIGGRAFSRCSALTELDLGTSVADIGKKAFQLCTSLRTATIPASVGIIHTAAFKHCTSLQSVHIVSIGENGCRHLGYRAFHGCTALSVVQMPQCIMSCGAQVFQTDQTLDLLVKPAAVLTPNWEDPWKYAFPVLVDVPLVGDLRDLATQMNQRRVSHTLRIDLTNVNIKTLQMKNPDALIDLNQLIRNISVEEDEAMAIPVTIRWNMFGDLEFAVGTTRLDAISSWEINLADRRFDADDAIIDLLTNVQKLAVTMCSCELGLCTCANVQLRNNSRAWLQPNIRIWAPDAVIRQLDGPFARYTKMADVPDHLRYLPGVALPNWGAVANYMFKTTRDQFAFYRTMVKVEQPPTTGLEHLPLEILKEIDYTRQWLFEKPAELRPGFRDLATEVPTTSGGGAKKPANP